MSDSCYLLIFAAIFLSLGVAGTCTGEAWTRGGRVIHRDEEPKKFWEAVITHYLIGLAVISYYLYKVY